VTLADALMWFGLVTVAVAACTVEVALNFRRHARPWLYGWAGWAFVAATGVGCLVLDRGGEAGWAIAGALAAAVLAYPAGRGALIARSQSTGRPIAGWIAWPLGCAGAGLFILMLLAAGGVEIGQAVAAGVVLGPLMYAAVRLRWWLDGAQDALVDRISARKAKAAPTPPPPPPEAPVPAAPPLWNSETQRLITVTALAVAASLTVLVVWWPRPLQPGPEILIAEALAAAGHEGAQVRRMAANPDCERGGQAEYQWSAPGVQGRVCDRGEDIAFWVDRTWTADRYDGPLPEAAPQAAAVQPETQAKP